LLLNKNTQIIKITKFINKNEAMDYFNELYEHDTWVNLCEGNQIETFIISNPNFIKLFKEKELLTYKKYFSEKYLNY